MSKFTPPHADEAAATPSLPRQQSGDQPPVNVRDPRVSRLVDQYWRTNVRLMAVLLTIWAAVGLGAGILFADFLNQWNLPGTGFPLGFWFAQQGSILTFILIILVYCLFMNRLDRKHHEQLQQLRQQKEGNQ